MPYYILSCFHSPEKWPTHRREHISPKVWRHDEVSKSFLKSLCKDFTCYMLQILHFTIITVSIKIFKHVQIHSLKQNWNFAMTFFQFYEMWCVRVPLTFWLLRSLLSSIKMYYLFTLKFVFSCFFVMSPYFQRDMLPPMGGPVLWRVIGRNLN